MKVTTGQLDILRDAIAPLDLPEYRDAYRAGSFTSVRYRWDLLHAAGGWQLIAPLYDAGLNDSHIDTALRAIIPPL